MGEVIMEEVIMEEGLEDTTIITMVVFDTTTDIQL